MKTAIYAGSFDPLTLGHMWIINRSLMMLDKLVVVVANNHRKKYRFPIDVRLSFISHIDRIIPLSLDNGSLADYAKQNDIPTLIRGARNTTDFAYEQTMALINNRLNSSLHTILLLPPPELSIIESSLVRELLDMGINTEMLNTMVPVHVMEIIDEFEKKGKITDQ